MEREIDSFVVVDEDGERWRVTQYAVPAGKNVIGGNAPEHVWFQLDDGTELQPLLGCRQFVDSRRRRIFKRT